MTVARFMKVSLAQFKKDCLDLLQKFDDSWYDELRLPQRASAGSAGYDFYCPFDVTIEKGEMVKIPLGIRVKMEKDYVLALFPRSSMGFKYHMALANTVGIIDSDYFGADNEGHLIAAIVNNGDKAFSIAKGERFIQGIFLAYYLAEEDEVNDIRHGGLGSSGK